MTGKESTDMPIHQKMQVIMRRENNKPRESLPVSEEFESEFESEGSVSFPVADEGS